MLNFISVLTTRQQIKHKNEDDADDNDDDDANDNDDDDAGDNVEFDARWSPFYMRGGPHRSTPYGNLGRAKACHNLPIQYQHSLAGGHQTRVKTPDWPQDRTPGDQTMTKKDTRTGTPDWSQDTEKQSSDTLINVYSG